MQRFFENIIDFFDRMVSDLQINPNAGEYQDFLLCVTILSIPVNIILAIIGLFTGGLTGILQSLTSGVLALLCFHFSLVMVHVRNI